MASPDPRIGTQMAEYHIEGLLGHGGMGVVYLAEHIHLGKKVAVKVLPPEYASDAAFRERFEREARLAASLEHPNIVPVTDAGEADGELWIAMRYVEGSDLGEILRSHGPLNPIRAVSILGRVGSALDAAHQRGLVHRDVKPGNILLEPPSPTRQVEHVYLTDFGLSKQVDVSTPHEENAPAELEPAQRRRGLTRVGYFAGTVEYAAPEQFRDEALDGRADIYALGCVLYECLTGRAPFAGEDERAVMLAHLNVPPPHASALRRGLPRGLDAVIVRAMSKDREARFPDCRTMIEAARSFLAGWNPDAPGVSAGYGPSGLIGGSSMSIPAASMPGPAPGPPVSSTPSPPSEPSRTGAPAESAPASVPSQPPSVAPPSAPPHAPPPPVSAPPHAPLPPVSTPPPPPASIPPEGRPSAPPTPPPTPPMGRPLPPATPRRRASAGASDRRTLFMWVLAGAAAAVVVVLILVLAVK
ncbi:MAG TPA: serine/threonine-protein kinase [Actinomycetota bacterium]